MSEDTKSQGNNASWNKNLEALLVSALQKAKDDGKWGDNNPKPAAWTDCVTKLAGSEKQSGGAAKNAIFIKSRWQKVCFHCLFWIAH